MLNVSAPFPLAGSTAFVRGTAQEVRIIQRNADGSCTVEVRRPRFASTADAFSWANRGATRTRRENLVDLFETPERAVLLANDVAPGPAPVKLKPRRQEQLELLHADGAFTRQTAVAVALGANRHDYRCGILSAMVGERLVENAYLPVGGDRRRRVSHYWLTPLGRRAAEAGLAQ